MKRASVVLLLLVAAAGCNRNDDSSKPTGGQASSPSLADARRGFTTKLTRRTHDGDAVAAPPSGLLQTVHYTSPAGSLAAYVSPDPGDGRKHPAIIWVFGGFSNSIGDTAWKHAVPSNDQSASAFRKAGIVMMYPSLRGGNDNPGFNECFLGEVDDLLAAADYLAAKPYVDPARIYLGGHSTGGTLVLLASEVTDRFRAVFSFGPVPGPLSYGKDKLTFDTSNPQEVTLRSPGEWLDAIRSPVFVFEGANKPSNLSSLEAMKSISTNPQLHFYAVQGASHFSILAPVTQCIAEKVLRDQGPKSSIDFSEPELNGLAGK